MPIIYNFPKVKIAVYMCIHLKFLFSKYPLHFKALIIFAMSDTSLSAIETFLARTMNIQQEI